MKQPRPRKYTSSVEARMQALENRVLALEEEVDDAKIRIVDLEEELFDHVPDKPLKDDPFTAGYKFLGDIFDAWTTAPKNKEN